MASTQIVIIGAGPSGLLLSLLLRREGIDVVVLERQTREYVESRIRGGLLEWDTVKLLEEAGVGARLRREGLEHDGVELAFDGRVLRIDLQALAGRSMMVYGQTEIQKDLGDAAGDTVVWRGEGCRGIRLPRGEAAGELERCPRRAPSRSTVCRRLRRLPRYRARQRARPTESGCTSASTRSAGSDCCPTRRR